MKTTTLSNDFMQGIVNEGAWKELSSDLNWTEALLEKYQAKVDWQELSENENVIWTIPMLQKFKHRINWTKLSRYSGEAVLSENCIATFIDKWNWHELSVNTAISAGLIEKFVDKWDWAEIIGGYNTGLFSDDNAIEFYERYKEYIPVAEFQMSYLWTCMVEQRKKQILAEITA